jgi:hypothetical protein
MIEDLKQLKIKTLITYKEFSQKVLSMRIPADRKVELQKKYLEFVDKKPKRTDFINFDDKGFFITDNVTLFKGFLTNEETGSELIKVPTINEVDIKIAKNDIVIEGKFHVCDQCWNYEVFAQYFSKFNNQEPLKFNL